MEEHNIIFIERTFKELREGIIPDVKDPYHIMAVFNPKMQEAFLNNPAGYEDSDICQILALDGDNVIGVNHSFGLELYINREVVPVMGGSYMYSLEEYRKHAIGAELFQRGLANHKDRHRVAAGISHMAIDMLRVMKFKVFEFPRLIYLRKSRCVIQSILKNESRAILPIIAAVDVLLVLHRHLLVFFAKRKGFIIEKCVDVPQEVEDIVLNDNHPYMEFHGKKWMEWKLKYTFSEDERNKKSLYVVKKDGIIEAFFIIKQEFFEEASSRGFRNVYLGSVMEWGIKKESMLTESDLYVMALEKVDKEIDAIQIATSSDKTVKRLKTFLFAKVGNANMAVRFKKNRPKGYDIIENWRIRLAGNDTLIN